MRISDWSSDVCSSDLAALFHPQDHPRRLAGHAAVAQGVLHQHGEHLLQVARVDQYGQGRYAVAELDLVQVGRDGFEVDRKSVVWGKSVSVRVDLGGRRLIKKKNRQ